MAPYSRDARGKKFGDYNTRNVSLAGMSRDTVFRPFSQTLFGRLPPELREKVFIELLATPPSYAGHDFDTIPQEARSSPTALKRFVHITASWYQVAQTCRQIYIESRPIFFASRYYYLDNLQELRCFLNYPTRRIFRWDTITGVCVKNIFTEQPKYTREQIDGIISDPNDFRNYNTRQELETMTFKTLDFTIGYSLRQIKNLRTVGLCFRVGEEMLHVNFLYNVSGMQRGVVEFVDPSRWLIRPQNPEDVWSIQYACFSSGNYGRGKDKEIIPFDRLGIEEDVTDINTRAPGLKEGDERYVEVQIQRPEQANPRQDPLDSVEEDLSRDYHYNPLGSEEENILGDSSQESLDSEEGDIFGGSRQDSLDSVEEDISGDSASGFSIEGLFGQDSHETQLEVSQDNVESIALAETSGYDNRFSEVEAGSDQADQSLTHGLHNEDNHDSQPVTDASYEEEHDLLQSTDEEPLGTHSDLQCDHQTEEISVSNSLALVTHHKHTARADDRYFLLDSDSDNDQVQNSTRLSEQLVPTENFQHHNQSLAESLTKAIRGHQNPEGGANRRNRRWSKQPLRDIQDTQNPYTEEELESYATWLEQAVPANWEKKENCSQKSEELSPRSRRVQEHPLKTSFVANSPINLRQERRSAVSQGPLGVSVRSVKEGALCFLFLLIIIISERLSNADRNR